MNNIEDPVSANVRCVCCGQRLIDWDKIVLTSNGPIGLDCSSHYPERRCHGHKRDAE